MDEIVMAELYISCVKKDSNGVVTHVGIDGQPREAPTVAQWLIDKLHTAHTFEKGQWARVYPRKSVNGKLFLTTTPDSITENNLDFLDRCSY